MWLRLSFQPSGFDVVLDFGANEIVWPWTDSQSQVDCTRFPPITKLPNREAPPITELQWKSTNHGLAREKFARIANLWIHWFWRRWHRCDCKVHSLARSLWRQGAFLNFASKRETAPSLDVIAASTHRSYWWWQWFFSLPRLSLAALYRWWVGEANFTLFRLWPIWLPWWLPLQK